MSLDNQYHNYQFKRICLKVSGEMLGSLNDLESGSCANVVIDEILALRSKDIQLCMVVGAGNIFRGTGQGKALRDQIQADHAGMVATIVNAIVMSTLLKERGISVMTMSALPIPGIIDHVDVIRARTLMDNGDVVIFAAGLGVPLFTTDSAAASRAIETQCDALVKATKVDGVYDKDPHIHSDATLSQSLLYDDLIVYKLKIMDTAAVTLCRDHSIPIVVTSLERGSIVAAIEGRGVCTVVNNGKNS